MSHHQPAPEGKDPVLWKTAQERAEFKSHLYFFLVVNAFFWALWYFTGASADEDNSFPWPAWTTLTWGVWLAFHYMEAYFPSEENSVENEYQKLKNKQS